MMNEAELQKKIILDACKLGMRLWRNNRGAVHTSDNRFLRFGLANDSAAMNKNIKSSDLIGIKPRLITQEDVGKVVGQFVALEIKRPGWKYSGTDAEKAQLKFLNLVKSLGGIADFINNDEMKL